MKVFDEVHFGKLDFKVLFCSIGFLWIAMSEKGDGRIMWNSYASEKFSI